MTPPALRIVLFSLCTGLILLSGNILAQRTLAGVRIDFTAGRLYTLSAATRDALSGLGEPVEITLVYSRRAGQAYPAIQAHAARVREMLLVYEARSGGLVRFRQSDPAPFSPAEDEAMAAGIRAVATDGADPLYFGIIGRNMIDDLHTIGFLSPDRESMLEYDLTRMITRLDETRPARIGILSSLPGMRSLTGEDGYGVLREIASTYVIEQVSPDFRELPDVDVLMLAHPGPMDPYQEWLVDQFLLDRGRALFLVDPAARTGLTPAFLADPAGSSRSDLGRFSGAWGIRISEAALADASHALTVPVEGPGGRIDHMAHPLFMGIPAASMNQQEPITADLARAVNFGAPGAIRMTDIPAGIRAEILIKTGPAPSLMDAGRAVAGMSPAEALAAYEARPAAEALAVRLSGKLQTAFPGGPPQAPGRSEPDPDDGVRHRNTGTGPADIIIIADTDFLSDDFYIVPGGGPVLADNAALVINALDLLAGSSDLVRLRSRAPALRPMDRVEQMRQGAEIRYLQEQRQTEARLEQTLARLQELETRSGRRGLAETEAEIAELAALRVEIPQLRSRLREIEREYRRGIDRMEATLKAVNIWGGPLMVAAAGIIAWRIRRRRQRRRS